MGLTVSKRTKILPYVYLNATKSGASLSIGPAGKTINIGTSGISVSMGLGKGVRYRKKLLSWNLFKKTTKKKGKNIPEETDASSGNDADTEDTHMGFSWQLAAGCGCLLIVVLIMLAAIAAAVYFWMKSEGRL